MWPYEDNENIVSPSLEENEEMEIETMSTYTLSSSMSSESSFVGVIDLDPEDADDEDEDGSIDQSNCSPVDILLLKSIESYRSQCLDYTGQLPLRATKLQVQCEVLSVRTPEELRRTRVPPMSQVLWRPTRRSRARLNSSARSTLASQSGVDIDSDTTRPSSSNILSSSIPCSRPSDFPESTSPPEQTCYRRRITTNQNMPQPSPLARRVTNRVIKYARSVRNTHEEDMCCLDCGFFPICPVTGKCGHTRCIKCIERKKSCPCGSESKVPLSVNIVIRDLIGKRMTACTESRTERPISVVLKSPPPNKLLNGARGPCLAPIRNNHRIRQYTIAPYSGPYRDRQHIPMSARARFAHALELVQGGKYREAAPHLALAAASCYHDLRAARTLLAQVITVLCNHRDPRSMTRELNHLVRQQSSLSWLKREDMECILCCEIFTKPVTTPCGHMFCRTCLEKTMDYTMRCPLCLRGLGDFKLAETSDTAFVKGALASINALSIPRPMEGDDLVPIFVCTVAYPSVPCPLFIFDPRYWLMIRRVLESGSRQFGMVAMDRDKRYADYGTILEVRDCVRLEDGRSILSTIGLSRFKVIERGVRDGCEVARIQPIRDVPPNVESTDDLKMYASQIMFKALWWISKLSAKVVNDIENAFGRLPASRGNGESDIWWQTSDGPAWLWWLVAILPLRTEIKVLILSTDCLIKRMMAISRTLDAVEDVTLTTMTPRQCQVRSPMPNNN